MGNITELKQGSLNGLKRQKNECLVNAYNKGYQDGMKEFREVTNVEDTNEYQIGYKVGFEDGKKQAILEIPEIADKENEMYDRGVEDLTHAMKTYFPLNSEERLKHFGTNIQTERYAIESPKDLIAMAKAYEKKKQAEEEIRIGDIVYYGEEMLKAVVLNIVTEQCVTYAVMLDENGLNVNEELSQLKFIKHTDHVESILKELGE